MPAGLNRCIVLCAAKAFRQVDLVRIGNSGHSCGFLTVIERNQSMLSEIRRGEYQRTVSTGDDGGFVAFTPCRFILSSRLAGQ